MTRFTMAVVAVVILAASGVGPSSTRAWRRVGMAGGTRAGATRADRQRRRIARRRLAPMVQTAAGRKRSIRVRLPVGDSGREIVGSVRRIQFLGGPWDGALVLVHDEQQTVGITDGLRLHIYERGESFEGPKVRQVMRYVNVVPLPRREVE